MRPACKSAVLVALLFSLASIAYGAAISGTVKGPDGKPFKGAFVEAQDLAVALEELRHGDLPLLRGELFREGRPRSHRRGHDPVRVLSGRLESRDGSRLSRPGRGPRPGPPGGTVAIGRPRRGRSRR